MKAALLPYLLNVTATLSSEHFADSLHLDDATSIAKGIVVLLVEVFFSTLATLMNWLEISLRIHEINRGIAKLEAHKETTNPGQSTKIGAKINRLKQEKTDLISK